MGETVASTLVLHGEHPVIPSLGNLGGQEDAVNTYMYSMYEESHIHKK